MREALQISLSTTSCDQIVVAVFHRILAILKIPQTILQKSIEVTAQVVLDAGSANANALLADLYGRLIC